jgi:hypothetical protein
MNQLDKDAITYTEIILALPGDSKQKHFESLRYGIDNQVNSLRMYQAILLCGTEMASAETRSKFQLLTKFRIIPGGVGSYQFGDEEVSVAEIEEIIVGSKDMPFEDYVSCRIMNLFIETYVNNGLCEEIFAALRAMNLSVFDFLVFFHERRDLFTPKLNEILASYVEATRDDLFDSYEEANNVALRADLFESYLSGKLGSNELLDHKALLYSDLEEVLDVLVRALKLFLHQHMLLTVATEDYFDQLKAFILCKKREIYRAGLETEQSFRYDFESIDGLNYEIDPRGISQTSEETRYRFFHTQTQRDQIRNAMRVYGNHSGGTGRMIQRLNLRKLYRHFEPVSEFGPVGTQRELSEANVQASPQQ